MDDVAVRDGAGIADRDVARFGVNEVSRRPGSAAIGTPFHEQIDVAGVAGPGDFVVTVCDSAREELGDAASVHWSIPDPVRIGTEAAFDTAYTALEGRVGELATRLTAA